MTLHATVVNPLTEPVPAQWDAFVAGHRLRPGWHSGPVRAIDWCVQIPSSLVIVAESSGSAPVALFHARHFGPGDPGRFVTPGRSQPIGLTECRTAPVPLEAGFSFADGTDLRDRQAAVAEFERAVRRRAELAVPGIAYRSLLRHHLPYLPTGGRRWQSLPPWLVLDNAWPDLTSYLGSLPRKWHSQLKKIHHEIRTDPGIRVELAHHIDPVEAAWLAEVVRLRYTPRFPPRPPLPALAIAEIARLPGSRFLTYRGEDGRLIGYSTCYDDGTDLSLIWWGSRGETDGWRGNLYFDQYLRVIELMVTLGRRRLNLGAGMAQIKSRYGARPEPRWSLIGANRPAWGAPGRRLRRRPAPVPPAPTAGEAEPPGRSTGQPWLGPLSRLGRLGRLGRWVGRDPERGGLTTDCWQCGTSTSVRLLRLSHRRARYWCERCGAVVTLRGRPALAALRPAGAGSAAAHSTGSAATPSTGSAATPGSAPATATPAPPAGPDLAGFMPAAMLRWGQVRYRKPGRADPRQRPILYQRYREWDAHLRQLGPAGAARLAEPGEVPPVPGLPAFSQVVGAVQDACFLPERASRELAPAVDGIAGGPAALLERAVHALTWLAGPGQRHCWLLRGHAGQRDLTEPDRSSVEVALAALRAGNEPAPGPARAARMALFGIDGGPAPPKLLRAFPSERLVSALVAYLDSGKRPLREEVLSRLRAGAPPADRPAGTPTGSGHDAARTARS